MTHRHDRGHLRDRGWVKFDSTPQLRDWVAHAALAARQILADPANGHWYRHARTWFAGVNILPNDGDGALPGGPPLHGPVIDTLRDVMSPLPVTFEPGQLSACFPGYPGNDGSESASAHRFRVSRDAAHVDGLHAEGPLRRRFLREYHSFLLGITLSDVGPGQSPFVIWEGSHRIMRDAFAAVLDSVPPDQWDTIDLTEPYQEARRRVFNDCSRIELTASTGEAYIVHRHALHGMAPWTGGQTAPRLIAYFRPPTTDRVDWLAAR